MKWFKFRLISKSDEIRLIKAIQLAELQTSGEIRVHLDKKCKTDAMSECKFYFEKLNMHKTKERNGILFYVAIKSKSFAVWGDEGIHQKVNQQFWDTLKNSSIALFKQNKFIEALETSIHSCGQQLKTYFPFDKSDTNELPNDISY